MAQYRVSLTRTITVETSTLITANSRKEAIEKARAKADNGKFGEPHVKFRVYGKTNDLAMDADDVSEVIEIDDAIIEDE